MGDKNEKTPHMRLFARRGHLSRCRSPLVSDNSWIVAGGIGEVKARLRRDLLSRAAGGRGVPTPGHPGAGLVPEARLLLGVPSHDARTTGIPSEGSGRRLEASRVVSEAQWL